jgi:DNA-binding CsgD family transcriptional regulator
MTFVLAPSRRAEALDREIAGDLPVALAILAAALGPTIRQVETEPGLPDIVRLAVELGEQETAGAATTRAETLLSAGYVPRRAAAVAHCRGLLATDPAQLLTAADGYEQAGRPLPRAQALEAAANLLAERGDTAGARAAFAAALDIYTTLGAKWDLSRARAGLRRHGIRDRRASPRATTGWAALTPTEAKVAALVAEGRSNPEIAEMLVISRRTVENHVARALAKLQMRSRAEIIRAAAARQASQESPSTATPRGSP